VCASVSRDLDILAAAASYGKTWTYGMRRQRMPFSATLAR
jgi:hypothetical protein